VAGDPPRLVDVDRGTSRRVGGLPAGQEPVSVSPLGDGAIVAAGQQVFVLGRRSGRATPIGRATSAVASLDGRGVWLLEQGHRCRLREVALDGRDRRPPRRVPCTTGLPAETPLGLLVWTEQPEDGGQAALLDPGTGRVEARYPEVHGVAGDLVLAGDFDRFGKGLAVWRPGQARLAVRRLPSPPSPAPTRAGAGARPPVPRPPPASAPVAPRG
jgi:hypothetical protein